MASNAIKPLLIFSWGNPARGDDALGPLLTDQLEDWMQRNGLSDQIEILTDYQLQIEHATDLQGREKIIFVDASVSSEQPFGYSEIQVGQDSSYTTHALKPQALLHVYQQVYQQLPPPSYLLEIRGYDFELGVQIGARAEQNLQDALQYMQKRILM